MAPSIVAIRQHRICPESEIARVARKEIRAELESLKKANSEHRSAIAKLRRELAVLQKQLKQAGRERTTSAKEKTMAERKHRFSAACLAAHRTKLGLSVSDYGRLVGMSGGTIYLSHPGRLDSLGCLRNSSGLSSYQRLISCSGVLECNADCGS